jgi:hypothetical protein
VERHGEYDTIKNVATGQYLALEGDHAIVSQNPADWDVTMEYQGRFKIAAVDDDDRALNLTGPPNGAPVDLTDYTGARAQQWFFQSRNG